MSPKRAKKKNAAKRAGKKAALRKSAAKRPAKRPAKKKAALRKRATKKSAREKAAVRKVAATSKPASPRHRPFGGAIAGASAKDLALFDLVRARVEVQAAIQGMVAASAEVPAGEGKWNPRQIVLHLHYWDREMLPHVEPAALHNRRPPHTREDIQAENASSQQDLAGRDWEVAKRLMQKSREAVLEALQSLPEEPADMWSGEHAVGWLIRMLSHHDRHHAAVIKEARTRTGSRS
ncbi:MAG: DinB family protein [Candidatus Eisenbacteria bacterium]